MVACLVMTHEVKTHVIAFRVVHWNRPAPLCLRRATYDRREHLIDSGGRAEVAKRRSSSGSIHEFSGEPAGFGSK